MTTHTTLLTLAVAAFSAVAAQAQSSIYASGGLGERDAYYAGLPVPDDNRVSVGTFQPGFDPMANSANLGALADAWRELGYTTIRTIVFEPGHFAAQLYNTDAAFDNQKIWLWIYDTPDRVAPTAELDNVTATGLFSCTLPNWVFPPHDASALTGARSISTDEVNQAALGYFDADHLYLVQVPEPSTWILGLLGAGALVLTRTFRRRAA